MSELSIKDFIDKNTDVLAEIFNVSKDYDKLYSMLNKYLDELIDKDAARIVSSLTKFLSNYEKDMLSCFNKSIPALCFSGLIVEPNLNIQSPIEDIDYGAFWRCKGLTNLTTSETVKRIHTMAFQSCEDLKTINLGEGLQYIDDYAFAYCDKLYKVILPSSIISISQLAFGDEIDDNCIFCVKENSKAHTWCKSFVKSENILIL